MNFLELLFNVVYQSIYIFSCIEIFVENKMETFLNFKMMRKVTQNVSDYLQYHYPTQPPLQQYMFVEEGEGILVYKSIENELNMLRLIEPENYDFVLRNDYHKEKRWMNYKIIYDNVEDICQEYKVSCQSFLSFVVYHKNEVVDILLETKNYNYMVVGNKFGKKFVYYLLKNMGLSIGNITDFEYTLQIVTGDVKILHLTSDQEIVVGESVFYVLDV